jgi:hypothetical protein
MHEYEYDHIVVSREKNSLQFRFIMDPTWSQWYVAFKAAYIKLTQTTHGDENILFTAKKRETFQCYFRDLLSVATQMPIKYLLTLLS